MRTAGSARELPFGRTERTFREPPQVSGHDVERYLGLDATLSATHGTGVTAGTTSVCLTPSAQGAGCATPSHTRFVSRFISSSQDGQRFCGIGFNARPII